MSDAPDADSNSDFVARCMQVEFAADSPLEDGEDDIPLTCPMEC
jgi:hypothetical protein